ncbi:MAG: DUF4294 domain-containing protein [Prevotella sp.]|jgi:hypothetical protein|nr:DUF4294 domain-containing protein [Prevotella sp.]
MPNRPACILSACFLLIGAQILPAQSRKKTYYSVELNRNDTLITVFLPEVVIYAPMKFKNDRERLAYTKLTRDVRKTLPYAKEVAAAIIESYEMMQTFDTDKERQKFLEDVQKFIMDKYKPRMKKLTRTQGKILVKLIDRETNSSSYDIVKSLVGGFKAGLYNTFAKLFGNNLKTRYNPDGEDRLIERIATQLEQGGYDAPVR